MIDTSVSSACLADLAAIAGLSIGLVCDPLADDSERWCCSIGLDRSGVGPTPGDALDSAIEDMRNGGRSNTVTKSDNVHQLASGRWVVATWNESANQWHAPMTARERKATGCHTYFARTLEGLGCTSYVEKRTAEQHAD